MENEIETTDQLLNRMEEKGSMWQLHELKKV